MYKNDSPIFLLPPPKTPLTAGTAMKGRYRFEVRDARTDEIVRETDWMDNLITNYGLNSLGSGSPFDRCHIGTGTTTPAFTDTALATFAASTSTTANFTRSTSGSPLYEITYTHIYRFLSGSLNGNYSEVGVGLAGGLFSRALIVDGGGSPTTITVAATEYLNVYYSLVVKPDLTIYTSNVVISGTTYSVQRKPAQLNQYDPYWRPYTGAIQWSNGVFGGGVWCSMSSAAMSAVTTWPTPEAGADAGYSDAYVGSSYERTGGFTCSIAAGNISGGIKTMSVVGSWCTYQYEFAVKVPKDSNKTLAMTGKVTWARA